MVVRDPGAIGQRELCLVMRVYPTSEGGKSAISTARRNGKASRDYRYINITEEQKDHPKKKTLKERQTTVSGRIRAGPIKRQWEKIASHLRSEGGGCFWGMK